MTVYLLRWGGINSGTRAFHSAGDCLSAGNAKKMELGMGDDPWEGFDEKPILNPKGALLEGYSLHANSLSSLIQMEDIEVE